ncbi:hypothetical protein [Klebsiella pneumoniae]|uniref:hypothetical protein n=1 Tax=Klebsiella pneumoniae TaxID=573 RepID=UPI00388E143B
MEIKKISINDFRGEMGVMRGYNDDSEDIKLAKEYYLLHASCKPVKSNSLWYRNHKGR